jgi:hypothetical protein
MYNKHCPTYTCMSTPTPTRPRLRRRKPIQSVNWDPSDPRHTPSRSHSLRLCIVSLRPVGSVYSCTITTQFRCYIVAVRSCLSSSQPLWFSLSHSSSDRTGQVCQRSREPLQSHGRFFRIRPLVTRGRHCMPTQGNIHCTQARAVGRKQGSNIRRKRNASQSQHRGYLLPRSGQYRSRADFGSG